MKKKTLPITIFISAIFSTSLFAQISITSLDTPEVVDFTGLNGYATFGNAVLTAGEFAGKSSGGAAWNPITSSASSNSEYGFGSTGDILAGSLERGPKNESGGGTAGLGEYAIGSTASDGIGIEIGSETFVDGAFYVRFRNNTGATVNQWNINYDGLFSNLTNGEATATFRYSSDNWATTPTVAALSFSSGGTGSTAAWVDAGITEQTISASVANGSDLIMGWVITGTLDGSAGDVIAFDNISITAIPEPSTMVLVGIILGTVVLFRRRR